MRKNKFRRYEDRETLERIRRWPHLINRFPRVRIYSAEHGAYWRGTGKGYTSNPEESEIYWCRDAVHKTRHCEPEKHIQYIEAKRQRRG